MKIWTKRQEINGNNPFDIRNKAIVKQLSPKDKLIITLVNSLF